MRSSTLFLQLSGLVFLIPIGAVAQNTGTIVGAGVRPGVSFGPLARAPIVGLPYSAQQTIEHTQTLADGTHIHDAMQQTTFYRDSQGRTRTEHRFTPPPGAVAGIPAMIQITDPVAGYSYTLEERNHIARRQTLQSPFTPRSASPASTSNASGASRFSGLSKAASTASAPAPVGERPRPQFSHESLGTQVIEGLTVEGTRTTVTYPEGFFGNDRPITSTSDTWYSRDLNLTVLSETDDPRQGKSVTKLTNISRDEPDPALFQIPSDYTVEDQPEPNLVTAPANR